MKKTYLIIGGAKSGKSSFAETLACVVPGKRAYVATAQALDEEMLLKIQRHKQDRGDSWDTFEEPISVASLLQKLNGKYEVVLLDCLTLWLSNIMMKCNGDQELLSHFESLAAAIKDLEGTTIIVSNEVGLGIVPDNPLARRFRDCAGILNQKIATIADEVYFTVAGIPMKIK